MTEEKFDPEKLSPVVKDMKHYIKVMHNALAYVNSAMSQLRRTCEHHIVRDEDSAVCQICGEDFGWWCPESPDHKCEYPDGEEVCRFCGQPDERK